MKKEYKKETVCVQEGWSPKKGEPRVLPIYQSTTFKYDNSEQMARLFDLEDSGYFYTRCRTLLMMPLQLKLRLWKAVLRECLHLPVRRLISMPYSIFVRLETISCVQLRFMAEHTTSLVLR